MNPRSESLNGAHPSKEQPKTVMAEAFESAEHLVDRVKDKTADIQKQASNYLTITADYAKEHPWRVALTAAGIGAVVGALVFRRRN